MTTKQPSIVRRLDPRAVALEAAVLVAFAALAVFASRPLARNPSGSMLVGPDPIHHLWLQNWVARHVFEPSRTFAGNVFYPVPDAVVFTDMSLGTTVFLVPLALALADRVALFNAGVLVALAFGGWGFYLLVRCLTGSRAAGLVTGIYAAFGSHQLAHLYHLNLLTIGWIPLFALSLHHLLETARLRWVVATGVCFALIVQSSGYYAVAAAVIAIVFAARRWRELLSPRLLGRVAAAVAVSTALAFPYLSTFLQAREREQFRRPPGLSRQMAFHPTRDLGSGAYLHRAWLGEEGERMFPGVASVCLATLAVVRGHPLARVYAVAAGSLVMLSFGPDVSWNGGRIPLPYGWLASVPPLDGMRHPNTFAAVAIMLLAVVAGFGWARSSFARRRGASAAIVLLALVETAAPGPRVAPAPVGVPPVYELLDELPEGPVLEVPFTTGEQMLWAARLPHITFLNGHGAFRPRMSELLDRLIENHWLKRLPEHVDDSKVTRLLDEHFNPRWVIVPVGRRPKLWRLAAALDESRRYVPTATAVNGDRLYEFLAR